MQSLFFDAIILLFLFADGLAVVYLLGNKRARSRKIIFAITLCVIAWGVIFYGSFIEPARLVVVKKTITLNNSPENKIKIALVSDLHVGPYKETNFVKRVVKTIKNQQPDIIMFAGDFVYNSGDQVRFLQPLKELSAPLGVFAVLGNHDYSDTNFLLGQDAFIRSANISESLEALGMTVLINDGVTLDVNGKKVGLIGTDDFWTGRASIGNAIKSLNTTAVPHPLILLSHNPDMIYFAKDALIDLLLAGHTHAGQIRLPFIGSVPGIPTSLGRFFDRGLFEFENTKLFITSGAGEQGPRARLFNPPEVAIVTLEF